MSDSACSCCKSVAAAARGENARLIHTFEHCIWIVGQHGFHRGYTMLVYRGQVKDLHELSRDVQRGLFEELMTATRVAAQLYQPWKMNHSSYGNVVPHIHWHIFPRYMDDPDRLAHPWIHADRFGEKNLSEEETRSIAMTLRDALAADV
jgi:diadenosine tetraphosphate (Ap4A) HIT family hydrolase